VVGTDRGVDILSLAARQRERIARGEDAVCSTRWNGQHRGAHLPEWLPRRRGGGGPETGHIDIPRYIVVDDVGHALNPLIVRGQVHGGVAQGIGQAFLERTSYDKESGQLLSASFMDYCLPRATDLPDIEVDLIEVPCETNPLGVKGAGEAGP
jgi:carbon-monoxide dehydrogenase large subunit